MLILLESTTENNFRIIGYQDIIAVPWYFLFIINR